MDIRINSVAISDSGILREQWDELFRSAQLLMDRLLNMARVSFERQGYFTLADVVEFRRTMSGPVTLEIKQMQANIANFSARAITATQTSVLASAADQADFRINSRKMIAAFNFKEYKFFEAEAMSYEDQFLGMQPASQKEESAFPNDAEKVFSSAAQRISDLLIFVAIGSPNVRPTTTAASISGGQYKQDTAFIMMMMSDDHPELEDVKVGIVEVFHEFGIRALRADDIEHEGSITDRIKQEISSSEFLIADLTGARPNVYYEVGYAHALGKRTILYRRKDTALHFDLAGLNVPNYSNVADLKKKLRARLEAIVGYPSPLSKNLQP